MITKISGNLLRLDNDSATLAIEAFEYQVFIAESTRVEDDHMPFLAAGVPSVDIIDLDYEPWYTAKDTLDAVSARSLQVVGG